MDEEEEEAPAMVPRMNTGLMSAYEFDPEVDGLIVGSVRYVCLNVPGRPQIEGALPEGTIKLSSAQLYAPEENVQLKK